MDNNEVQRVENGIAAYRHEREVFMRLLRRRKQFTDDEFDRWFRLREFRRPLRFRRLTGDTFILGGIGNGWWGTMLELLQWMVWLGQVNTKTVRGHVIYHLPPNNEAHLRERE